MNITAAREFKKVLGLKILRTNGAGCRLAAGRHQLRRSIISHDVILSPKLTDLNISPMQSHRWHHQLRPPITSCDKRIPRPW